MEGKNELELPTWWLWAVTLWDLNLSYKVKMCFYAVFHFSFTVNWVFDWYLKSPAYTAFMHSLPGCLIFSLPASEELLTRRAEYCHFFHVCAANGNIHWNKWQNAAIVVVAAVYLIILILSYKMDNHWKRYIGLSVILSLPFTFTASLGFVLCKLERYEKNIIKRKKLSNSYAEVTRVDITMSQCKPCWLCLRIQINWRLDGECLLLPDGRFLLNLMLLEIKKPQQVKHQLIVGRYQAIL